MTHSISKGSILINSDFGKSERQDGNISDLKYDQINTYGINYIGLSSYTFIDRIPNINKYNKTGVVVTIANSYPITIPEGTYTETDLASAVQASLIVAGFSCTVTWNDPEFVIVSSPALQIITNPINGGKRDFFDMMGMKKDGDIITINTSSKLVNLNYSECIYILSRRLMRSNDKVDFNINYASSNIGVIYRVPNPNKEENRNYSFINNIKWINCNELNALDSIDIIMVDDQGNEITSNKFSYRLEFLID